MLASLKLELRTDKDNLSVLQSSNLQGVIMQKIDTNYAERLHVSSLNPYSQYLRTGDETIWYINALTNEAYEEIIQPLMNPEFRAFRIEKKELDVSIVSRELVMKDESELLSEFYEKPMERQISIEFLTPTSFKSNGNYIIFPELRLIYQSLMNKYSAASSERQMFDEETLEQLVQNSFISNYRLKSVRFPMEGIFVPGFQGHITIRMKGPETLSRYIRMLCEFGEYSGVGIKTSIGMGAMKIRRKL